MKTRQATIILIHLTLLASFYACSPSGQVTLIPSPTPPTSTATLTPPPTLTPTPTLIPTATPLACLSQPGRVEPGSITSTKPSQDFLIYLPPCYNEQSNRRYPVLYLLHGQTYTDDQWIRIGAVKAADRLILSGESAPFIIVFPDDHYWNLDAGPGFGDRLVNLVIPTVDQNYRTIPNRDHRAIGGLSRGGGWTVRLGLTHWQLFGMMGLHSPAVFIEDGPFLEEWIRAVPRDAFPRLWFDIGEQDKELGYARKLEDLLAHYEVLHEFHLYQGQHTEEYWSAHVKEYIQWYAEGWANP